MATSEEVSTHGIFWVAQITLANWHSKKRRKQSSSTLVHVTHSAEVSGNSFFQNNRVISLLPKICHPNIQTFRTPSASHDLTYTIDGWHLHCLSASKLLVFALDRERCPFPDPVIFFFSLYLSLFFSHTDLYLAPVLSSLSLSFELVDCMTLYHTTLSLSLSQASYFFYHALFPFSSSSLSFISLSLKVLLHFQYNISAA